MSIQKVVVDTESYQWVPGGSLTVQGWKAVEGESAAILVLDEKGEPVKAEVKFYPRPDVVKRYPSYAAQADELGFRVKLGDFENFIKVGKGLKILLKAGAEEKVLLEKNASELEEGWKAASIQYYVWKTGRSQSGAGFLISPGKITFQSPTKTQMRCPVS